MSQHTPLLYNGQASTLADYLDESRQRTSDAHCSEALRLEAGYFRAHHERMPYRDFQAAGAPIGSGTIEAGAKQVKARFSRGGMRWSQAGLSNAMPFCMAVMSGRFDALWKAACPC